MHNNKTHRTWRDIAEEASHEKNPERLLQLAKELEQAFDQHDKLRCEPQPGKVHKTSA